jgi:hypothetical protein
MQRIYLRREVEMKQEKEEEKKAAMKKKKKQKARDAKDAMKKKKKQKARDAKDAKNTKNVSAGSSPPSQRNDTQQKKLRLRQSQNHILLASPLRPSHLSLPLIPQASRTELGFGQPCVVRLLKMPMVIINASLPFL